MEENEVESKLEGLTHDDLKRLASRAENRADEISKKAWKEAEDFWKNFEYEYEFRATQVTVEKETYYRDKKIEKAVRIEARYTKETIEQAKEAYDRFEGRRYGTRDLKENKWEGMTYFLVDGKVVASTGGGTVWVSTLWEEGGWNDKETYLRRLERVFKAEKWLEGNPADDEVLSWKETSPWKK